MHGKMSNVGRSVRREEFEVSQKEQRVMLLRKMIRDFEAMVVHLDGQIATEEDRTRVKDPAHPAYSTLAVAAAKRRQNVVISLAQVRSTLEMELRDQGSNHLFAANTPLQAVEVQSDP